MKTILSIDGGGMRGIIPAVVLEYMEYKTEKPISQMFDLIAGTSTGGLLGLVLTCPIRYSDGRVCPRYTAKDAVQLYEHEGVNIFRLPLWKRIITLGGTIDEKYPSDGVQDTLLRYLMDYKLSDALTNVFVTSYDIERQNPFFFKSMKAENEPEFDFTMVQAARATSAAPTYFEPYELAFGDDDYMSLVDGGLVANNPSLCALAEAIKMWPGEDYLVISLGTGRLVKNISHKKAKDWGLIGWAKEILPFVFDAQSDAADHHAEQLLPPNGIGKRYYRFQTKLTEGTNDMDDVSPETIRTLRLLGNDLINTERFELNRVCEILKSHETNNVHIVR